MYLINTVENSISEIAKKTFKELKIEERKHLQEWIINKPNILGEDLLIIQKEYSNFQDTNERLDLLALDKLGNLVIIENKLDNSGKEVLGQALKYTAYCSTLKKDQIINIYQDYLNIHSKKEDARVNLIDFFNVDDISEINFNTAHSQRIMLVAREFKKEVTATVLWLNAKLKIQCFKVTPFQLNEFQLLNIEQIIPIKDAEDFIIRMAEKNQEDIENQEETKASSLLRIEFWKALLEQYKKVTNSFLSISPSKDSWVGVSAGISGVAFNFSISKSFSRVELYISTPNKEQNKAIFKALEEQKEAIELKFGDNLIWEELSHRKASRIKYERTDLNILNEDRRAEIIDFMSDSMFKLENVLRPYLVAMKGKF